MRRLPRKQNGDGVQPYASRTCFGSRKCVRVATSIVYCVEWSKLFSMRFVRVCLQFYVVRVFDRFGSIHSHASCTTRTNARMRTYAWFSWFCIVNLEQPKNFACNNKHIAYTYTHTACQARASTLNTFRRRCHEKQDMCCAIRCNLVCCFYVCFKFSISRGEADPTFSVEYTQNVAASCQAAGACILCVRSNWHECARMCICACVHACSMPFDVCWPTFGPNYVRIFQ